MLRAEAALPSPERSLLNLNWNTGQGRIDWELELNNEEYLLFSGKFKTGPMSGYVIKLKASKKPSNRNIGSITYEGVSIIEYLSATDQGGLTLLLDQISKQSVV